MALEAKGNGFYFNEGDVNYCVDYVEMFAGLYDLRLLTKSVSATKWSYADGREFDSVVLATSDSCDKFFAGAIESFNKYLESQHGKASTTAPVNGIARLEWSLNNLSYDSETKQITGI
jgi:hypothetical protein